MKIINKENKRNEKILNVIFYIEFIIFSTFLSSCSIILMCMHLWFPNDGLSKYFNIGVIGFVISISFICLQIEQIIKIMKEDEK